MEGTIARTGQSLFTLLTLQKALKAVMAFPLRFDTPKAFVDGKLNEEFIGEFLAAVAKGNFDFDITSPEAGNLCFISKAIFLLQRYRFTFKTNFLDSFGAFPRVSNPFLDETL